MSNEQNDSNDSKQIENIHEEFLSTLEKGIKKQFAIATDIVINGDPTAAKLVTESEYLSTVAEIRLEPRQQGKSSNPTDEQTAEIAKRITDEIEALQLPTTVTSQRLSDIATTTAKVAESISAFQKEMKQKDAAQLKRIVGHRMNVQRDRGDSEPVVIVEVAFLLKLFGPDWLEVLNIVADEEDWLYAWYNENEPSATVTIFPKSQDKQPQAS